MMKSNSESSESSERSESLISSDSEDGHVYKFQTEDFRTLDNMIRRYKICLRLAFTQAVLFLIGNCILCYLWLAETHFGQGILRPKYLNESCDSTDKTSRPCIEPFYCDYDICRDVRENEEYWDRYWNFTEENCPKPDPCPKQECKKVTRVVKYHDYQEYLNVYFPSLDKHSVKNYVIDYGHCKGSCSSNSRCHAVCYSGVEKICIRLENYELNENYSANWSCAVKLK